MKKMVRGLVLVVCLALFAGMAMGSGSSGSTTSTTKSKSNVSSTDAKTQGTEKNTDVGSETEAETETTTTVAIDYVSYDYAALLDELSDNPLAAKTLHDGEYVEVTGYLNNIDSDGKYFSIGDPEGSYDHFLSNITCNMQDDYQRSQLASLTQYDEITVRGLVTDVSETWGYTMDVYEIVGVEVEEVSETSANVDENGNPIYTSYTCEELFDELEGNALAAEQNHNDEYMEITGYIHSIDGDGNYITIGEEEGSWNFNTIHCNVTDDSQLEQIITFSDNQQITVRCQVVSIGEILGYTVDIIEFV